MTASEMSVTLAGVAVSGATVGSGLGARHATTTHSTTTAQMILMPANLTSADHIITGYAGLLDCSRKDRRPRRIQEIYGPASRHLQEVRREDSGPRRPLSNHGRPGVLSPPRRHRVPEL